MLFVSTSSSVIVTVAVVTVAVLAFCVLSAARKANLMRPEAMALGVFGGLSVWLAGTAGLARRGVFEFSPGKIPLEPLLPVSLLITFVLLSRSRSFGRMLHAIPLWLPVALQTFRVGVETAFWLLFREGVAPVQVTFEGRNLDVLVGLTAPLVATLVARRLLGPRWVIAWNTFGIACLLNAIGTVATSAPGPQHLGWPGEPFTALGRWPVVWIPAVLAPLGLFLHIVSIRQCLRAGAIERSAVGTGGMPSTARWNGRSQPAAIGGNHHGD